MKAATLMSFIAVIFMGCAYNSTINKSQSLPGLWTREEIRDMDDPNVRIRMIRENELYFKSHNCY